MVTGRTPARPQQPRSSGAAGDRGTPAARTNSGERRTFGDAIRRPLQARRLSLTADGDGALQVDHPARREQVPERRIGWTEDGRVTFLGGGAGEGADDRRPETFEEAIKGSLRVGRIDLFPDRDGQPDART